MFISQSLFWVLQSDENCSGYVKTVALEENISNGFNKIISRFDADVSSRIQYNFNFIDNQGNKNFEKYT
jgi:hypothetical protein